MKDSIRVKKSDGFLCLDHEWAELIIKTCFEVNELRRLFQMEIGQDLIVMIRCDQEIKDEMDTLIGSFSIHELKKNIKVSSKHMENRIRLYETVLVDFKHKTEIIYALKNIGAYLKRMEEKIVDY